MQLLGDGFDAVHTRGCSLRSSFLHVTADVARKSYDTVVRRNADISCIDTRLSFEFIHYGLLQTLVAHGYFSSYSKSPVHAVESLIGWGRFG